MNTSFAFAAIAAACIAAPAVAGTTTAIDGPYRSLTTTAQKINTINDTLTLTKFDASLGNLLSIDVTLVGTLTGTAKGENKDAAAAQLSFAAQATLTLARPDLSAIVVTAPAYEGSFDAAAYDGVTDYSGASGTLITLAPVQQSEHMVLTSAADRALFTSTGANDLSLAARLTGAGTSSMTSSGNAAGGFSTKAFGYAEVSYTYALPQIATLNAVTAVPEPGTWALLCAGLGMVGLLAARRRRND